MEPILILLIANWKIIAGAITAIAAWHKDKIMDKLNITLKKNEVKGSTVDVWEKKFNLQENTFDNYVKRKEAEDKLQELRFQKLEERLSEKEQREDELMAKIDKLSEQIQILNTRLAVYESTFGKLPEEAED